jgi:hypothetical protein
MFFNDIKIRQVCPGRIVIAEHLMCNVRYALISVNCCNKNMVVGMPDIESTHALH